MVGLWFRRPVTVNTDPQRRCYDGVHASSRVEWSAWGHICDYRDRATAEDSAATFKRINPEREYEIRDC
jgi:hypothetical protein